MAGLEDHLKRYLPNSDIKVELINDNVVLSGTVDTPLDAKRAEQIAQLFVSGGEATTGQFAQTAAGGSATGGVDINNPDSERRVSPDRQHAVDRRRGSGYAEGDDCRGQPRPSCASSA